MYTHKARIGRQLGDNTLGEVYKDTKGPVSCQVKAVGTKTFGRLDFKICP